MRKARKRLSHDTKMSFSNLFILSSVNRILKTLSLTRFQRTLREIKGVRLFSRVQIAMGAGKVVAHKELGLSSSLSTCALMLLSSLPSKLELQVLLKSRPVASYFLKGACHA